MTTPATTPLPANPLEGFTKIKDKIHTYHPSTPAPANSTDPTLLILCSWAFAPLRPLSKYIKGYQSLYPHTSILLLQNEINNMLFTPDSWQFSAQFNYAAEQVKQHMDNSDNARILLALFSNGGSHSAVQLSEAYKQMYNATLPIHAIVLDSTPGKPHWSETHKALMTGVPKNPLARLAGSFTVHSMLFTTGLMHASSNVLGGYGELATWKLWRVLNEPGSAFLREGVPRTYIHSEEDIMILSKDVREHAEIARGRLRGLSGEGKERELVKIEEFVGTPHTNHMSSDPARYWGIVRGTWEASLPSSQ
jgi:hypothetical protein